MSRKHRIAKWGLIGLSAIVLFFAGLATFLPNTFKVERSETISSPASTVFGWVNDLHKWKKWSPWEELDPNMKQTFEGPETGPGAIYAWDGNNEVGAGKLTILESQADKRIKLKLEFFRPHEDACETIFAFEPNAEKTKVTWTMSGDHTPISKVICFFMNMDKMVGGDFEKGLAKLKSVSETAPSQVSAAPTSEATTAR